MKKCIILWVALCLSFSGCLKTRAQLKDDGTAPDDSSKPVKADVQDVHPQGQYMDEELKAEMTRIEGRVEDLEHNQKQSDALNTTSKDDSKKLEQRVSELEAAQTQMLEAIKKLQDQPAVAADPEEVFQKGKAAFDAENYDEAISAFDVYLKNTKATRPQEATFMRAEAYYGLKQYKKAIVDYSKFPEKYTNSKHLLQALYKIGLSFDALGMHDDAKGFYQELVEKYPRSAEAKKVRSKLK